MKKILVILVAFLLNDAKAQIYHTADYSGSEPIIIQRCVSFNDISKQKIGYIKETTDKKGRCIKLEFFINNQKLYSAVDMPSIVEYKWTDSCVVEELLDANGDFLSVDGNMIRPNRIEYFLCNSKVFKKKEYFGYEFLREIKYEKPISFYELTFFMMYHGCEKKYNQKYRLKF